MAAYGDQHMFSNARNIDISGGTFVMNAANSKVNGFQILLENVSQGAFHNAAERGDPPRCHPRTRLAIRAEIMEWIRAPLAMRKLILWMYGPAGSGKTAIAQSIAEECEQLGLLAGSFFFWRSAPGRNNADQFVATLAYQLSRYLPQIENHLFTAIERDPKIFTRSLTTQMRTLVIEPLKYAAPLPVPIAAIVDGVDECGPDGRAQSDLLHQLGSIALELQHLPLIFLVASRPEYEIREAFNGDQLSLLAKVLVLDNNYKPDEDIKLYLNSIFRDIYEKNIRLGCHLPLSWPSANDVNFLVSKASGQFIFASTVTKFVDSPRHNPADRLNIILQLSNLGNETPFAPLDALYRFILGSVTDIEKVLEMLTWLFLASSQERYRMTLDKIEELLDFDIRRILIDMHALLFVPPPTDNTLPRIYHASLSDFLMDRSRSLEYYIDKSHGHVTLARRWLKVVEVRAQSRISTQDAVSAFITHCKESPPDEDLLGDLARFDLRVFLDRTSNLENDLYDPDWKGFVECVDKQRGGREDLSLPIQNDLDAFILDRLGQYPQSLQPFIPILLLGQEGANDMLDIVLHAVSKSAKEFNEMRKLDERLLQLQSTHRAGHTPWVHEFLKDATRAEKYLVHPGSYPALIKTIVNVICAWPGERNHQIKFRTLTTTRYLKDGSDPTKRIALAKQSCFWFDTILAHAPIDLNLASFLLKRAVQFRSDINPKQGRERIAKESIKYIERCGIPFLAHTHPPHTNKCAICTMYKDAVVLEAHRTSVLPSVRQQSTSHAPLLSKSDAHEPTTVLAHHEAVGTQVISSPLLPPKEFYFVNPVPASNFASQSKRKRMETLTSPTPAYTPERSQAGKRRQT